MKSGSESHNKIRLDRLKSLQERLRSRYQLGESKFSIGKESILIQHVLDSYALLDDAEEDSIPYWAEVWPSAVALAGALQERRDLMGKRCLELGAGLGLASCMAALKGAEVTASDYLLEPLEFAQLNALLNRTEIDVRLVNWLEPFEGDERFEIVLAADVLYSHSNIEPVARFLPTILEDGATVLLADPRRNHLPRFIELMHSAGFQAMRSERTVAFQGRDVLVDVYVISR